MSVGVVAGSSSSAAIRPDLRCYPSSSTRPVRGLGGRVSFVSARKRWGSLRSSPPPSSFVPRASSFRAAVEGGVEAEGKSFYELLGIPPEGTAAEIKRAYKEMARRYHPDVCPSPDRTDEYTRRFIEVQEAYETLSDPGRRALYDRDLACGLHLAFSARRRPPHHRGSHDEEIEGKSQWRNRWQDQVAELKRRRMNRNSGNNLSWGAQMRRQREESSTE